MKTCTLSEFLQALSPWLSGDYIRKGYIDENSDVVLMFTDGVNNVYRIDDCTQAQLSEIIEKIRKKGIPFETRD